jgi:D-methionine transport system ATP-binding protein
MDVVRTLAHRMTVMEEGRVVEQGDVATVFARPQADVTRRFVGTLVEQVPTGDDLAALAGATTGRLVSVDLEAGGSQARVLAALAAGDATVMIVQGGVNRVRGTSFGHVVLAVDGAGADAAVAEVAGLVGVEVLR